MPRYVDARAAQEEPEADESSSEEEEEEDEEEEEEEEQEGEDARLQAEAEREEGASPAAAGKAAKGKISISLKGKDLVCHVCGKTGHKAGFVGSVYLDCPEKPCYLCKATGHTTLTCPYRSNPETGCAQASGLCSDGVVAQLLSRQLDGRRCQVPPRKQEWHVDAAILKLHSRRCTCLAFHPTSPNLVLSGDKKGQVAIWDFMRVTERTVYSSMHGAITNQLRFLRGGADPSACASTGADGRVKVFDAETGQATELLNLNPDGWIPGVTTEKSWTMMHGLGSAPGLGLLAAGDSRGSVHFLDPRQERPAATQALHKKGNKVNCLDFSPLDGVLLMSASNDWTCRLHDIRKLSTTNSNGSSSNGSSGEAAATLVTMDHPRVVSTAYFSPRTGSKILTTCLDNRIRVWDKVVAATGPPAREIVHSHDFNRYLSPFRAEWDPKDPDERLFVIGRYISEDFGGAALHPIDIIDAATGRAQAELVDPNLATISPVNKPHPTLDVIVSGSSRSLYAWRPRAPGGAGGKQRRAQQGGMALPPPRGGAQGGGDGAADDDGFFAFDADDDSAKKKKRKAATAAASPEEKGGAPGQATQQKKQRGKEEGYQATSTLAQGKKKQGGRAGAAPAPGPAPRRPPTRESSQEEAAASESEKEEEEEESGSEKEEEGPPAAGKERGRGRGAAGKKAGRGRGGGGAGRGRGKGAKQRQQLEEEEQEEESGSEDAASDGEERPKPSRGRKAAKRESHFAKFARKPSK